MKKLKLNVLLAKTEALSKRWKDSLADYTKFFKGNQGSFKGIQKTYTPKDDSVIIDPKNIGTTYVVTTVDEKLDYFRSSNEEYINALFSQEKTNAMGLAVAELIVEGESWGKFSSLELLRLKSLIENQSLKNMCSNIPVRSDARLWEKSTSETYGTREVFETTLNKFPDKTTVIENYILIDPNIGKSESYSPEPVTGKRNTTVELGVKTVQEFSGEWSHVRKAGLLKKLDELRVAVIEALKQANNCEVVESELTADKLFNHLLR